MTPEGKLKAEVLQYLAMRGEWVKFWSYVDKSGECWIWNGGTDNKGYGRFNLPNRTMVIASRLSWAMEYGWPDDMYVFCIAAIILVAFAPLIYFWARRRTT